MSQAVVDVPGQPGPFLQGHGVRNSACIVTNAGLRFPELFHEPSIFAVAFSLGVQKPSQEIEEDDGQGAVSENVHGIGVHRIRSMNQYIEAEGQKDEEYQDADADPFRECVIAIEWHQASQHEHCPDGTPPTCAEIPGQMNRRRYKQDSQAQAEQAKGNPSIRVGISPTEVSRSSTARNRMLKAAFIMRLTGNPGEGPLSSGPEKSIPTQGKHSREGLLPDEWFPVRFCAVSIRTSR